MSLPGEGRIMGVQGHTGTKINNRDIVGFWGQHWEKGSPLQVLAEVFSRSLGGHCENFQYCHSTPLSKIWEYTAANRVCFEGTDLLWEKHCQKQEEALSVLFSTFWREEIACPFPPQSGVLRMLLSDLITSPWFLSGILGDVFHNHISQLEPFPAPAWIIIV